MGSTRRNHDKIPGNKGKCVKNTQAINYWELLSSPRPDITPLSQRIYPGFAWSMSVGVLASWSIGRRQDVSHKTARGLQGRRRLEGGILKKSKELKSSARKEEGGGSEEGGGGVGGGGGGGGREERGGG